MKLSFCLDKSHSAQKRMRFSGAFSSSLLLLLVVGAAVEPLSYFIYCKRSAHGQIDREKIKKKLNKWQPKAENHHHQGTAAVN